MAINENTPPLVATAEAKRKFEYWQSCDAFRTSQYVGVKESYFRRGVEILSDLASAHYSRQKPHFWEFWFGGTQRAREYREEKKLMEQMVREFRQKDPEGRFGQEHGTLRQVDYRHFLNKNRVRHELFDWDSDYMRNIRKQKVTFGELDNTVFEEYDRKIGEIEYMFAPTEQEEDVERVTVSEADAEESEEMSEDEPSLEEGGIKILEDENSLRK